MQIRISDTRLWKKKKKEKLDEMSQLDDQDSYWNLSLSGWLIEEKLRKVEYDF